MPRETVNATRRNDLTVDVGWSRDTGIVQITTTIREPAAALTTVLAGHGLALVDAKTGDPAGTAQVQNLALDLGGWHVEIEDRREVNRLINVVRTARDQAMGKDA